MEEETINRRLLWTLILSPLPIKQLLAMRSVSKFFVALTSDPDFISLHLRRFPGNRSDDPLQIALHHPLFFPNFSDHPSYCVLRSSKGAAFTGEKFVTGFHLLPSDKYLQSTPLHGLLLLITADDTGGRHVAALWNPSIRKFRRLPPISLTSSAAYANALNFGLGFDLENKDYKVLAMVNPDRLTDRGLEGSGVWVYSVRNLTWAEISDSGFAARPGWRFGYEADEGYNRLSVSIGSGLFWVENWKDFYGQCKQRLAWFDFVTEKFRYADMPEESLGCLKAVDGGSSLVTWGYDITVDCVTVWVWALDTNTMSWTKPYKADKDSANGWLTNPRLGKVYQCDNRETWEHYKYDVHFSFRVNMGVYVESWALLD